MLHSNQHSKSILERKEAIYVCDNKGYIKLYNKAAANLWGREPQLDEDLYCGALKLLHSNGNEIGEHEYPMAKILKENIAVEAMELLVLRPDGTYKKITQSATPLFDRYGELTGVINLLIEANT
jgi:PAS domain-containing protein